MGLQKFPMRMTIKKEIKDKKDGTLFSFHLCRNDFYRLSQDFSFLLIEIMGQAAELNFEEETGSKKNYLVAINEFILYNKNIENIYEKCCVQVKNIERWNGMYKTAVKITCGTRIIAKCICLHCNKEY